MGYKITRTTVVLASASSVFKASQDADLRAAVKTVCEANFDLERIENDTLEVIYAAFDDDVMTKVRGEFEFLKGLGNIVDYGGCVGTCALCGKGDSRDDGMNEDKLRYGFKLSNVHGGEDLWVGHSCIYHFGLRVQGAETAEEAKAILQRSLREHIARWKIETWQAQYPKHRDIPDHYDELRKWVTVKLSYLLHDYRTLAVLGIDGYTFRRQLGFVAKKMRTSARFYQRREHLTDAKMDAWVQTQKSLAMLQWLEGLFTEARDLRNEDRMRFFAKAKRERDEEIAAAEAAKNLRRGRVARECA